jgi:hypothetical protein
MAAHVNIPATGSGDAGPIPVATIDDGSGDKHQKVIGEFLVGTTPTPVTSAAPLPVVQTGTPALPTGAATESTLDTRTGSLTESAPGTDTASSGINGRLQRVAQRITSLIALLPASLGQKTSAASLAVVVASDQSTMPVSLASVPSHAVTNAGTFATQESQLLADNAAFTDGTTKVFTTGYVFDEVAGTALTENDIAAGRVDSKRAQVYVQEDATTRGQRQTITAAGAAKVDGSAVTQPVSLATNTPIETRAATGAAPTAFTATTSTQVFASNASRKRFTVYNNSDKDLFLMFASAAVSTTSYHVIVKANGGFFSDTDYSGEIRGIMSAAITTGQVNPGEFT